MAETADTAADKAAADTDDIQDCIRRRAHELWEREGHPHGRHDDHWAQAEAEIRGAAAPEPAGRPAAARPARGAAQASGAGKGTRAAAQSLSETAAAPAGKAAKAPAPKSPRAGRKDGGKGTPAG